MISLICCVDYFSTSDDDRRIGTKSSGRYSGRDGYQDHMSGGYGRSQAEPEWFTDGPKNQSDTIELGGFETINKRERLSPSIESEESSNRSGGRNLRDSGSTDSATKKIALGRKVEESEGKGKPAKPRSDSNKASERTTKTAADVELQNKAKLNVKDSARKKGLFFLVVMKFMGVDNFLCNDLLI